MIYKIKDPKQINYKTVATSFIRSCGDTAIGNKILKGIVQKDSITTNTIFTTYMKNYSFKGYSLLENKDFIVVTKENNIVREKELKDIYESLGIRNLVKSNDVTVMISVDGEREIIRRDKSDENDNLKAIMLLLLKRDGYRIDDIYTIANNLPVKQEIVKAEIKEKPSKNTSVKKLSNKVSE